MTLQQEAGAAAQNLPHFLNALYCEEEAFDGDFADVFKEKSTNGGFSGLMFSPFSHLLEHDLFWEDSEIETLISKEKETHLCSANLISDGSLMKAMKEAIDWVLRVNAHYGFCALTAVLAVNYFDRFVLSIRFQRDKPWMTQLTAVACLSLAAKVQETRVPLLLDLQIEESNYVFEAKNVQRMELLVMSTLQWRMHPVTPIAFFDHITRRLLLKSCLQLEFLYKCESLLLSAIADVRLRSYVPSVMAAALMMCVIKESEPYNGLEYQEQLIDLLKTPEDKVNECYKLIQELWRRDNKRKHFSLPSIPIGVMDASFSYDSSNDSWFMESSLPSLLSSRESGFKRKRVQY